MVNKHYFQTNTTLLCVKVHTEGMEPIKNTSICLCVPIGKPQHLNCFRQLLFFNDESNAVNGNKLYARSEVVFFKIYYLHNKFD